MLYRVLCYVLLSATAGSVFSHTLPLPHEKPPEWEQPVVISEEFFPPHSLPHQSPHHLPHNEFKEIIGIELQRIPFHGSSEHEVLQHGRHKEHEILEHRKHEILEHGNEPPEHGFLRPHVPHEVFEERHREHEILPHELPPPGLLEQEHEHEHHSHEYHNVLEHEHSEFAHREHEHREHEIMTHEHPHDHEILEHEHHEHDISAHQLPHEPHHPPWEDPDFVLSEEEHLHEHEHEFHHEELFPEVSRRRTNGRREGNSRRNNSNSSRRENSNRRGNSNRRENSNRQGNNNRRENSNRESSRRNREGPSINTEELFPRRNRQNNNRRNNNSNNRRNNNNREGSRRNSNIEELSALEEEILMDPEVSSFENSRPERDVGSYFSENRRETPAYESSPFKQVDTTFQSHGYSNTHRPTNSNFETKGFSEQQAFASEGNAEKHSDNENSRRFSKEQSFGESRQKTQTLSNFNNQEYSNSGFLSSSNVNENTNSGSGIRRPDRPSGNIFVKEEEYLTLDNTNLQHSNAKPVGSIYNTNNNNNNNNGHSWTPQELSGSSRPGQSNTFNSNKPGEISSGGSSRPGYLGSRPGSGKPLLPGSHSGQGSSKPRPGNSSSGLYSYEEERPNRPSSGSSGSHSYQEERPNRPSSGSSGLHSYQEERPNRPSSGSSGLHSYQEERPNRPSSGSSGSHSYQEERPNRPSSGSSGSHLHQESSSSGHFSSQGSSKPGRPSNSHSNSQEHSFHEESSRPQRPNSKPAGENSRPQPTNGNNLTNATDLISVQEDSWLWPNQFWDEDKKNRRADSGGNRKPSGTTKRPTVSGSNSKKQHANLKLLPTDTCGVDLGNKIIGGENTQLDEFPWMALLQHSSAEGRALGFGCGGSLISPRYVLTAAHCIKGPAIGNNIRVTKVRLGEFDVSSDVDCQGEICSPPPVDISVEEIIVHPKYRATDRAQLNDIALIRLRENVKTSAYISPICLPLYGNKDYAGEKLTVAGWGKTSNGQNGASSKTKQKVTIPVVTLKECSPFYNRINIQLNNTQMCAGGERGKDSCQGDSGGPLMGSEVIDSQIRWQVHGIVSFGPEDCGIDNVAGVYTKVSEYIDWILDNMKR